MNQEPYLHHTSTGVEVQVPGNRIASVKATVLTLEGKFQLSTSQVLPPQRKFTRWTPNTLPSEQEWIPIQALLKRPEVQEEEEKKAIHNRLSFWKSKEFMRKNYRNIAEIREERALERRSEENRREIQRLEREEEQRAARAQQMHLHRWHKSTIFQTLWNDPDCFVTGANIPLPPAYGPGQPNPQGMAPATPAAFGSQAQVQQWVQQHQSQFPQNQPQMIYQPPPNKDEETTEEAEEKGPEEETENQQKEEPGLPENQQEEETGGVSEEEEAFYESLKKNENKGSKNDK